MKTDVEKLSRRSQVGCGWPKPVGHALPPLDRIGSPLKLRLLLCENSVHDELAILNELHQAGFEVSHKRVETAEDFLAELKRKRWDLIICDDSLPGADGLMMLRLFQALALDVPVIMVSARIEDSFALEALKAGACDYVMKRNLSRLVPAIERKLMTGGALRLASGFGVQPL